MIVAVVRNHGSPPFHDGVTRIEFNIATGETRRFNNRCEEVDDPLQHADLDAFLAWAACYSSIWVLEDLDLQVDEGL